MYLPGDTTNLVVMCVNPILINNSPVPCGRCYECQSSRRSEWAARNLVEASNSARSYFCTLTFDDAYISFLLDFDSEAGIYLFRKDIYQRFLKRLRKDFDFRYYLVHEYGSHTLRPHYHVIFYFQDDVYLDASVLANYWSYGFVSCDKLTQARIHYVTKYLNKSFRKFSMTEDYLRYHFTPSDPIFRTTLLNIRLYYNTVNRMSTRPAIGYQFLYDNDMISYIRDYAFSNCSYPSFEFNGQSFRLPRYYIRRIFTDEERKLIYETSISRFASSNRKESVRYNLSVDTMRTNKVVRDNILSDSYQSKVLVSDVF